MLVVPAPYANLFLPNCPALVANGKSQVASFVGQSPIRPNRIPMKKTLSGDRNQCPGCSEYFNSTFAFDKHRTGEFGISRRCMSNAEMKAKGMSQGVDGFWISKRMPAEAIPG